MASFTSLQVREDMGADSERRYCRVVRVASVNFVPAPAYDCGIWLCAARDLPW